MKSIEKGAIAILIVVLASLVPAAASQVRPINLEQMTERAAAIFAGRVIDTEVAVDPDLGREVTVATFDVDRGVKGEVGSTFELRMLGGASTDAGIAGMPRFRSGDDVVLFVYGRSNLGLASPVGMGQGRFSVYTDKQGRRVAVNDFANRNLFRDLTPQAATRLGPSLDEWRDRKDVEPGALLDMVESLMSTEP